MRICRFCGISDVPLVHTRWCKKNPSLQENRQQASEATAIGASARTKKAHAEGKFKNANYCRVGRPHTEEVKKKLSEICSKHNHRRLVRSRRLYTKKDGSTVMLDSSWEEALAKRLDSINVEWSRPDPIHWMDEQGKGHNYFADFYLPEFKILLDPKNPRACLVQEAKIKILTALLPNLVIIKTLEDCKTYSPRR